MLKKSALIGIFCLFFFLVRSLYLKDFPPWPDEAVFVDIALNLLNTGKMGTGLWEHIFPHIDAHAYWYPPTYFYMIAGWIKLFGVNPSTLRLLPLIASTVLLWFLYLTLNQIDSLKKTWIPHVILVGVILANPFLSISRITRPEIFVLCFSMIAIYFYLRSLNEEKNKNKFLIFSGLASAATFLMHFLGIYVAIAIGLHFLFTQKLKTFTNKSFYLYGVAVAIPVLLGMIPLLMNIPIVLEQLAIVSERKGMELPQLFVVILQGNLWDKCIYFFYFFILGWFLYLSFIKKNTIYLFLSITLILTWIFSTYGQMGNYMVYPVVFTYIALAICMVESKERMSIVFFFVYCILTMTHMFNFMTSLARMGWSDGYYDRYTKIVLETIPDNKTVFLISIPDPYFAFKMNNRNNKLYQYPYMPTSYDNYLKQLNTSDYIVFTGSYDGIVFGRFLIDYIQSNQVKMTPVKVLDKDAFIIELKPASARTVLPAYNQYLSQ